MVDTTKRMKICLYSGEMPKSLVSTIINKYGDILSADKWSQDVTPDILIVENIHDARDVSEKWNFVSQNIWLICLSPVTNMAEFLGMNGKLVLNPEWMSLPFGESILERFFSNRASVNIEENYGLLNEAYTFKMTSHLNFGLETDRMANAALAKGYTPAKIKSYFDHLAYYLFYLKQDEMASFPFEVEYGTTDTNFMLQVHLKAKNFNLSHLQESFKGFDENNFSHYLLSLCLLSCDLMEFKFIESSQKLVICAYWMDSLFSQLGNFKSLIVQNVPSGEAHHRVGAAPQTVAVGASEKELLGQLADKSIPEKPVRGMDQQERDSEQFDETNLLEKMVSEDYWAKLLGTIPTEELRKDFVRIINSKDYESVKGWIEDQDIPIVIPTSSVSGEKDCAVIVRGEKAKGEVIQRISGRVAEDNHKFIVKGGKIEVDDYIHRVTSTFGDQVKGAKNLKGTLIKEKTPLVIRSKLQRFADDKGINIEYMTPEHYDEFTIHNLPGALDEMIKVDAEFEKPEDLLEEAPELGFRYNYEQGIRKNWANHHQTEDSAIEEYTEDEQNDLAQQMMQKSLKQTAQENYSNYGYESPDAQVEQDGQLIRGISESILHKAKVSNKDVLGENSQAEKRTKYEPLGTSAKEDLEIERSLKKLALVEVENKRLVTELSKARTELRTISETKEQLNSINKRAAKQIADLEDNLKKNKALKSAMNKVKTEIGSSAALSLFPEGQSAHGKEKESIDERRERDRKILDSARHAEIEIKKIKIEIEQKELLFSQELEKANRMLKNKDLIIEKAKESLKSLGEKKDAEIKLINEQTKGMPDKSKALEAERELNKLNQHNTNLQKLVESYKAKVNNLSEQIKIEKEQAGNHKLKDDFRKLQAEKNKADSSIKMAKREYKKIQDQLVKSVTDNDVLQQENTTLTKKVKILEDQVSSSSLTGDSQRKTDGPVPGSIESELKESKFKITRYKSAIEELEAKVTELNLALSRSGGSDATQKTKMSQMEGVVKKLTQDLGLANKQLNDAKREANKLRSETTALQNQVVRMKKDMEKAKNGVKGPAKRSA